MAESTFGTPAAFCRARGGLTEAEYTERLTTLLESLDQHGAQMKAMGVDTLSSKWDDFCEELDLDCNQETNINSLKASLQRHFDDIECGGRTVLLHVNLKTTQGQEKGYKPTPVTTFYWEEISSAERNKMLEKRHAPTIVRE